MKKIFLFVVLWIIVFFASVENAKAETGGCNFSFSPSRPIAGQRIIITVTRNGTSGVAQNYKIVATYRGNTVLDTQYPLTLGVPYQFFYDSAQHGILDVTVCKPASADPSQCDASDKCGGVIRIDPTPPAGGVGGDPLKNSPRGWLPQIVPDFGPPPSLGINFFKNNLAQFLISLLVFFTIVLSLIFTIIGGIMLSMAGGNKEGMGKAKATITYALVGLALGLGSLLILSVVGNFFKFSLTGS